MLGNTFYNGLIRKYIIYFGSLFKDIYIERLDSSNNVYQTIAVPLIYAPANKLIERIEQFKDLSEREIATKLPRMSFEIVNLGLDTERKLNNLDQILGQNFTSVFNPVPYNINFVLSIYVKNAEDGAKIVEQIIPYFAPEWTDKINLLPGFPPIDIPITLQSVTLRDTFEGQLTSQRYIIWSLGFTMRGYFFKNIQVAKLIKQATVNLFSDTNAFRQTLTLNANNNVGKILVGEQIYQQSNTGSNTGIGVVVQANNTTLYVDIQNGYFTPSNTQYVEGVVSKATAFITATANTKQPEVTIVVEPGLTALGQPTSNSSLSIPYTQINPTDNFGFVTDISEIV
jgi:hypothetical protein